MVSEDNVHFGLILDDRDANYKIKNLEQSMNNVVNKWTKIRKTISKEIYNISSAVMSTIGIVRAVTRATGQVLDPIQESLLTSLSATMSTIIGIKAALSVGSLGLLTGFAVAASVLALGITLGTQAAVMSGMAKAEAKIDAALSAVDSAANLALALGRWG